MEEIWKQIVDYPNYYISNFGNIKNKKNKLLKNSDNGSGYIKTIIYNNNIPKTFYIHRLVAKYFLENYDENLEIDHIDRNSLNNSISNLRMATRSQNCINKKKRINTYSTYVGVTYDKNKNNKNWKAKVRINGKNKHIGNYNTEEEAYLAYINFVKNNNLEFEFRKNNIA